MRVKRIPAEDVRPELVRKLKTLTFPHGLMKPVFMSCRKRNSSYEGIVYVCYEDDEVVGWALRWRNEPSSKYWICYFYVRARLRRNGYGTALMKAATRGLKNPALVDPWDSRSKGFFNKAVKSKRKIYF